MSRSISSSTRSVILRMTPESSATWMKMSGRTISPSGRRQRTSASAPTQAPDSRSTIGWYCMKNSWLRSAARMIAGMACCRRAMYPMASNASRPANTPIGTRILAKDRVCAAMACFGIAAMAPA